MRSKIEAAVAAENYDEAAALKPELDAMRERDAQLRAQVQQQSLAVQQQALTSTASSKRPLGGHSANFSDDDDEL